MKTLLTTVAVLLALTTTATAHHNGRADEDIKYTDLQMCAIDAEVIDMSYVTGRSIEDVFEVLTNPDAGSLRSVVISIAYEKAALIRDGHQEGFDFVQVMDSVTGRNEAYDTKITACLINYVRVK